MWRPPPSSTPFPYTTLFRSLLDTAAPRDVPEIWYQVRKKLGDIRHTLPPEAIGPFFNDEFGDVFGSDRKSTRLNSSHGYISYAVFCLKKKKNKKEIHIVLLL